MNKLNIIIKSAKDCFIEHGYRLTTIAMISRNSNISRVTIYKLLGSKKEIMRQIVQMDFQEKQTLLNKIQKKNKPTWKEIEFYLIELNKPVFTEKMKYSINNELDNIVDDYCQDLLVEYKVTKYNLLKNLLKNYFRVDNLNNTELTVSDLAISLTITFTAILKDRSNRSFENVENMMKIYKAACLNISKNSCLL